MANPEHLAILRQGVEIWNDWRQRNEDIEPIARDGALAWTNPRADLRWSDLNDAKLFQASLSGADLRGAHLNRADLRWADISEADLSGTRLRQARINAANLCRTELTGADLRGADFSVANLNGANLSGAILNGTDLSGAVFNGARLDETAFIDTNLRHVEGLDACQHWAPSAIDHRTFLKSGPSSLPFLRGCGLPDQFIEYLPSLFNQAIQFYSCFISYSTRDQAFAERLHADLQNSGVRCWFAPHSIQAGKKVHEQIDEAIRLYDRLLLILSEHSMNSEWVKTEISKARKRELREHRHMLFPVSLVDFETLRQWECFDADSGKDSAREIREYFIQDFSEWKSHDPYQTGLERLLKDLKAEER